MPDMISYGFWIFERTTEDQRTRRREKKGRERRSFSFLGKVAGRF